MTMKTFYACKPYSGVDNCFTTVEWAEFDISPDGNLLGTFYVCTSYQAGVCNGTGWKSIDLADDLSASEVFFVCTNPLSGCGYTAWEPITIRASNDIAMVNAINTHAQALENNTNAMNDFFTLSVEDVSLISVGFFVIFIIGNTAGRIAKMMRKV